MVQKGYKIGESISVKYRAAAGATSVIMNVYDETDSLDGTQSGAMTQIGSSNRWVKSFIPDTGGDWSIGVTDNITNVEIIRSYSVGNYNIQSIGSNVATVESKIDGLNDISATEVNSEVTTALNTYDSPTKAELETTESNIRGADDDTLKTLSDQIDSISPAQFPMIG